MTWKIQAGLEPAYFFFFCYSHFFAGEGGGDNFYNIPLPAAAQPE